MSLHSHPQEPVPEETARIARAAFRKGNLCIRLRDALGTIYTDEGFADVFSHTGRPAEAPWRLALVSVLQYVQELSDRQAAVAVGGASIGSICSPSPLMILASTFRSSPISGRV